VSGYIVRQATEDDISAVQRIARHTWYATYAGHIPDADIEQFIESAYSERALHRALSRLGPGFLVAETEDQIVGYAMVGRATQGMAELYAIYVLPEYHGVGIGKALWRTAVDVVREGGFRALTLWVLASNEPAHRFYERQGAVAQEEREFPVGGGMVLETRYVLWLDR
jgi:ribosomal protein S18 acetylase RimI-like enzyme